MNNQPDEDFYYEGPFVVFTAACLRKRGTCCGNGCRHCPYDSDGNIVPGKGERGGLPVTSEADDRPL